MWLSPRVVWKQIKKLCQHVNIDNYIQTEHNIIVLFFEDFLIAIAALYHCILRDSLLKALYYLVFYYQISHK